MMQLMGLGASMCYRWEARKVTYGDGSGYRSICLIFYCLSIASIAGRWFGCQTYRSGTDKLQSQLGQIFNGAQKDELNMSDQLGTSAPSQASSIV